MSRTAIFLQHNPGFVLNVIDVPICTCLFLRAILYLLFLRSCQPCTGDSHSSDEDSPPVEEEDTTSGPAPPPRRMGLLKLE